jgi:hypothetical protein
MNRDKEDASGDAVFNALGRFPRNTKHVWVWAIGGDYCILCGKWK